MFKIYYVYFNKDIIIKYIIFVKKFNRKINVYIVLLYNYNQCNI